MLRPFGNFRRKVLELKSVCCVLGVDNPNILLLEYPGFLSLWAQWSLLTGEGFM